MKEECVPQSTLFLSNCLFITLLSPSECVCCIGLEIPTVDYSPSILWPRWCRWLLQVHLTREPPSHAPSFYSKFSSLNEKKKTTLLFSLELLLFGTTWESVKIFARMTSEDKDRKWVHFSASIQVLPPVHPSPFFRITSRRANKFLFGMSCPNSSLIVFPSLSSRLFPSLF